MEVVKFLRILYLLRQNIAVFPFEPQFEDGVNHLEAIARFLNEVSFLMFFIRLPSTSRVFGSTSSSL